MTSPLREAPSTLFTWRTWLAVPALGALAGTLVCGIMAFGWHRSDVRAAEDAERSRLTSIGRAIVGDAGIDPASLERAHVESLGVASVAVRESPAIPAGTLPGRVVACVPIGDSGGFLVLEGLPVARPANAMGLPLMMSLGVIAIAGACGASFAVRTSGIRRVASALASIAKGETDRELLTIHERFGEAATIWNRIIGPSPAGVSPAADTVVPADRRETHSPGGEISTSTLDAIPVGIMGLDRSGRVLFCNGAAAAMLGVDRHAVIAEQATALGALASVGEAIRRVADGDAPRACSEMTRADGANEHTMRVSIRGLRKTDGAHVMLMIEDITQQRLTEAARDAFVAQATHELRTPLTNIKLAAEEAIDAVSTDPTSVSMSLNIVNQEARRLERVVTDMLSVSEMEAASMSLKFDDVSPAALLDDIEADYRAQAREQGIEFSVVRPPKLEQVFGDREKIGLLLHNIVGNAMKYTPRGGSVTVSAKQTDADWLVEVRDTGPGIAPDEQQKVFEKFYRASGARHSGVTGSGLGLALAAQIARLHGGEITLESEPGCGCTFTARLPRGTQAAVVRARAA